MILSTLANTIEGKFGTKSLCESLELLKIAI